MKRWGIIKEENGYWIVERGKILPPWAREIGQAIGPFDTIEEAKEELRNFTSLEDRTAQLQKRLKNL